MTTDLSGNGVSKVWLEDDIWMYKEQPKFLTDNEYWCFKRMESSGYVPKCEKIHAELIRTAYIPNETVINPDKFMSHLESVLFALISVGIRHGDLTTYSVLVRDDKPYLIDFAESRLTCDPRPDKRREGDRYWLERTMEELCSGLS